MKTIQAVDLFCGAGGTSTGMAQAAERLGLQLKLLAINHWQVAIASHTHNHAWAEHLCENLDNVDPRCAVPGGSLDLMVASPECLHHSNARGGRPMSDQSRSSAWHVLRWAEALYVKNILIENVPEFEHWGPLAQNGQPIKRLRGRTYLAFLESLRSLGYQVEARVINAADYGDPTTRRRLFILARRGRRVRWPEPTHSGNGEREMFEQRQPWVAAREIIDWEIPGESIFGRKRPLKENTIKRIAAGLRKFCKVDMQPFLVQYHGSSYEGGERVRSVDAPMATVAACNQFGLVQPFIVRMNGTREDGIKASACDIDKPLPTIVGSATHLYLAEPFIVTLNHGQDDQRTYPVDEPMKTITSVDAWGLVEPFIVKYNGTGSAYSLDDPLDTVTGKDRFGLVIPLASGEQALVDIRFRMLQPHELAAAMSFPADYQFDGTRDQRVKQIGNAVPVRTAAALCEALLS